MNDFSILDEIEKYLLEIFGHKTNALKLNKDFTKRCTMIHLLSKNYIIYFEINFHFLKIFFTKYFKKILVKKSKKPKWYFIIKSNFYIIIYNITIFISF